MDAVQGIDGEILHETPYCTDYKGTAKGEKDPQCRCGDKQIICIVEIEIVLFIEDEREEYQCETEGKGEKGGKKGWVAPTFRTFLMKGFESALDGVWVVRSHFVVWTEKVVVWSGDWCVGRCSTFR